MRGNIPEDVRAVAFIVATHGDFSHRVGQAAQITKDVNGDARNGRHKRLEVGVLGGEFGVDGVRCGEAGVEDIFREGPQDRAVLSQRFKCGWVLDVVAGHHDGVGCHRELEVGT